MSTVAPSFRVRYFNTGVNMSELYKQESKKPWQSKTLWVNLIVAAAAFFPAIGPYLTPEVLGTVFLVANTVLRFVTKEKLSIK